MLRGLTPSRLILLGSALLISAGLLVLAAGSDRGIPRGAPRRIKDPSTLAPPASLGDDEASRAGSPADMRGGMQLDAGAWVQVAGPDGRVKQRYTADRIDPRPGQWLEMVQPRAVMHSPNGRIVALRGDRGRAHVPSKALEHGHFEGNVVVSVWMPDDEGHSRDITTEDPSVVVLAHEATFDAIRNRIDAPGEVKITSDTLQFTGDTLELVLSPDGRSIELLSIRRPLSPLVITRLPGSKAASAPVPIERGVAQPTTLTPIERGVAHGGTHLPVVHRSSAPPEPDRASRPYRLQLRDAVHITRERGGQASSMTGDQLVAYFHLEEGRTSDPLVDASGRSSDFDVVAEHLSGRGNATPVRDHAVPGSIPAFVASQVFAAVPSPSGTMTANEDAERVVVRFAGPLVMRPAVADEHPPADDHMRIELDGRPVELADLPMALRAPDVTVDMVRTTDGDQPERVLATGGARATDGTRVIEASTMDILLDGQAGGSEPRRAVLTNGVRLSDRERLASAQSADIRFTRGSDGKAQPRRAELRGGVTMIEGTRTVGAGELDLDFVEVDGAAQPVRARLRTEVRIADAMQVLWAKEVDCAFGPLDGSTGHQLTQADASSTVQLQVKDGARVFADSLQADLVRRQALLRGPGLQVVRGPVRVDQISSLRVDERERSARVDGPGRAQGFERPILADAQASAKAKAPKEPTLRKQFEATWQEQMAFQEREADGAVLELRGAVAMRAEPEPGEIDLLDARSVTVEFLPKSAPNETPSAGAKADASTTESAAGGKDLRVSKVIAVGDAQVQNQVWTMSNGRRSGDPRLVKVQGDRLEFDLVRSEVSAPGVGSVLVNNPSAAGARAASFVGPGHEGVTRFRFADGMQIKQLGGDLHRMSMRKSVEVAHAGPREGDHFTLTCDALDADLFRPTAAEAAKDEVIGFGGAAEIRTLLAQGAVFVRTSQFECECESFDYDAQKQVAVMRAAPGRLVALVPTGQAAPTRAASFRWDMAAGKLTVEGAQGGMRR
ncbi:MAG: hypothetical protein FJ254_00725 [Phycisphaerae bacterium]|nr:hypothetical protein [Phycisphaerae bacterium]